MNMSLKRFGQLLRLVFGIVFVNLAVLKASAGDCVMVVSEASVTNFLQRPERVLEIFPLGGKGLAWQIRLYVVQKDVVLPTVLQLIKQSTFEQRRAIGLGLSAAARGCLASKPELTRRINAAVEQVYDPDVKRTFNSGWEPDADALNAVTSIRSTLVPAPQVKSSIGLDKLPSLQPIPLGDPFGAP